MSYSSTILADGPISYWKLDESSGTTATDSVGSNNGTYTGGYTLAQSGISNNAVLFNGSTGYVNIGTPSTNLPVSGNQYTLEAWVKVAPGTTAPTNDSNRYYILYYGTPNVTNQSNGFRFDSITSLDNYWWGNDCFATIPIDIRDGNWHHVVAVFDGSNRYLYFDGVLIGRSYNSSFNAQNNGLTIGQGKGFNGGVVNGFFPGDLDEVAIYNKALTTAQVINHYRVGRSLTASSSTYSNIIFNHRYLISYYRFNESTDSVAYDSKGNNHLYYYSGITLNQSGLDGVCPLFNGNTSTGFASSMGVPDAVPTGNASFTFELWFKTSVTQTSGSGFVPLLGYGNYGSASQIVELSLKTDNVTVLAVGWSNDITATVTAYNDGKWHHLAYTNDGGIRRLYFDGVQVGTSTSALNISNTNALTIGKGYSGDGSFNGLIDEVAIYGKALSAIEIYNHYVIGNGYNNIILNDSPVSYWPLNETSGTTANDLKAVNNGTYSSVTLNQGSYQNLDNSVSFNGSSSHIQVANSVSLQLSAPLSVEAWVKTSTSTVQVIIGEWDVASPNHGFGLAINADSAHTGVISFWTGGSWIYGQSNIADGRWHHVIGVLSGTTAIIYVDGILQTSSTVSPSTSSTNILDIGRSPQTGSQYFNGLMSSVAVYNSALTLTQIQNHVIAGSLISLSALSNYDLVVLTDSPISYWPLSDITGNILVDRVSSNHADVRSNITLSGVAPKTYMGGSVSYDGTLFSFSYITDATNLHLSAPLSLECWIKTTASGSFVPILVKYSSGAGNPGYGLSVQSGKFCLWVGSGSWLIGSVTVNDGNWHHVVGTLSGTTVTTYVDGVQDATGTQTPSLTNTLNGIIGADWTGNRFNGSISSLAIYNTALSAQKITDHYYLGVAQYESVILSELSLVSYWPMRESSGNTLYDFKSNNVGHIENVTPNQTPYSSIFGEPSSFNGSSSEGEISTSFSLHPTITFSIEAWIYITTLNSNFRGIFVANYSSNTSPFLDWAFYVNNDNHLRFYVNNPSTGATEDWGSDVINTWYHLVGTYDGSTAKFYINGSLVTSSSFSGLIKNTNQVLSIGRYNRGGAGGEYFPGYIEHIALYNQALTSTQVINHFNNASAFGGNLRVSQVGLMMITQGTPSFRASQIGVFIITPKITSSAHIIQVSMTGLKKLSDFTGGMN